MTYALHPMLFTGDPKLPRENPAQHKNMMHLLAAVWEEKELKTSGALIDVILSIRYIIVIHLGRRGQARCQVSWNHSFDDSFFFFYWCVCWFFCDRGPSQTLLINFTERCEKKALCDTCSHRLRDNATALNWFFSEWVSNDWWLQALLPVVD